MKTSCLSAFSALALIMAGCAPHAINPDPAPLRQASNAYSVPAAPGAVESGKWYEKFHNPDLTTLIDEALTRNLDIAQAHARLRQAGFLTQALAAGRLPAIDAQGSASTDKTQGSDRETEYGAGAALSWEIDAFNRIGSLVTAGRYGEQAAAADVEAVRLSVAAEIAEAYFSAIAQDVQLRLLRAQSATDTQLLELVKQRYDAGLGTNIDVLQQQSQLADNRSLIPPAESALRVYENRLDVLIGAAPDGVNRTHEDGDFADIGDLPPVGVPSDLLLNRPDLRALKDRLVAQDANIAAAIADRLPHVTLTGSYMLAAGPAAAGDYTASALASLVHPLLDWGRRKAEVERDKALYEERLAAFSQAYLLAVEDVENALYQETKQREYIAALEARSRVLNQTLAAAQTLYKEGQTDYMPVLDALQDLREVERRLVTQRLNLILYRIRLYRSLGGQDIGPSPSERPS